jgi:tetratricopeptide (TPR) repeat protein
MVAEDKIPLAMDRLVDLLTLAPQDAPARVRLRQLAEVSELYEVYVRGLLAAADAAPETKLKCAHWLEAARVHDEILGRHSEATALLVQVAEQENAEQGQQLTALRRLARVLARFGEPAQRLEVVQRLAQLAPEVPEQQNFWGQAAKLAAQLGDPERALAAWQKRLELDGADHEAWRCWRCV